MDKQVTYSLQVFVGGADSDAMLHKLKSDYPLPAFSAGNLINSRFGRSENLAELDDGPLYRIVSVEHGINEMSDKIFYYTLVYTTPVEDTDASRGF